jgi:protoporphyrinogen oxidase
MGEAVIIGAGPAGLTAAYCLCEAGWKATVFEADPEYVGGISRTAVYKGFRFDIGGHRFFSKSEEVEEFWSKMLGDDLIQRPRLSRIYYRGQLYSYPLKPLEALWKLGLAESTLCVLSYIKARLFPIRNPKSFEDWVTNQFGARLFRIFFKTYTEKVWGMSCKEISADWAAQRIQGLSLAAAVKNGLLPKRRGPDKSRLVKTLIDSFRYPRLGPGMMWAAGRWEVRVRTATGEMEARSADHVISTAAIRDLAGMLDPPLVERAKRAAEALRYRDFLTVALIAKDRKPLPDNWIYIHDPSVKVGRVQNFKSWSPELIPDPSLCCYGLEYFCFEGDGIWSMPDQELIGLATTELEQLGLIDHRDVEDGCVVRQSKAYPVYDDDYRQNVGTFAAELEQRYPGLHLAGRNGMHKYNNQDHAMMTGMLTARNIVAGRKLYDVWKVNQDAQYLESGLRMVPTRVGERKQGRAAPRQE